MVETEFQKFVSTHPGAAMFSTGELRQAFDMQKQLEDPDFDLYVRKVPGINIMVRHKLLAAFEADNAGPELDRLINHTSEHLISAKVRAELNRQWSQNFNEEHRFVK